jgi:hypothetical protein
MLSVIYGVSFKDSVTNKQLMLSVFILRVIMLKVVAPKTLSCKTENIVTLVYVALFF